MPKNIEEIMKLLEKVKKEMSSVHHCHLAPPIVSIIEEIIKALKCFAGDLRVQEPI